MVRQSGRRGRRVAVRGAILGIAIAMVVAAMVTNEELRNLRARQRARDAVASELAGLRSAIAAALDSTDQQLGMAQHLLGWLEETEDASSTGLVESLSRLRRRHRAPRAVDAIDELASTGRLAELSDASLRRRLLALQRHLRAASFVGESEFDRYRVRLEALLSPGMWRHVFRRENEGHVIDFRAQLRELHAADFDRTLRSLLRGIEEYRKELRELLAETRALLAGFQERDAGAQ